MTNEEFRDCLDRYGTNLERWPAAWRAAGRAIADTSEGRRQLDAGVRSDALLAETWRCRSRWVSRLESSPT